MEISNNSLILGTRLDVMDGENPNKRSKNCLESLCEKISKIFGYA
jgi:hypothetical protein